jgi:hypothetical protein
MQFIDSSIIGTHRHAAAGKKGGPDNGVGRSRGGLSNKIHAVVDGLPVKLLLTAGQASDKATAPALIDALPAAKAFVADRRYDAISF